MNEALFDAAELPSAAKPKPSRRRAPKPGLPATEVRAVRDIPAGCWCDWFGYRKWVTASRWELRERLNEVHPCCPLHADPGGADRALAAVLPYFERAEAACCGAEFDLDLSKLPGVYRCPKCGTGRIREDIIPRAIDPYLLPSRRIEAGGHAALLTAEQEADVDGLLF